MRFTVYDPQRLQHVIEFDSQEWHGHDNIAHGWEPEARQAVINAVLLALVRNLGLVKVPLPYGFTYATQD